MGVFTAGAGTADKAQRRFANLIALGKPNLRAAIVGKALYDGRTTIKAMNDAAKA